MAINNTIINIKYVSADILGKDNKSIGVFGVSQLSTTFSVGNIPTCMVHISDGTEFGSPVQTTSNIRSLLDNHNTDNLHILVKMGLSISTDSGTVNDIPEEIVFNGVVTGLSVVYNYMASGRSYYGVVINAVHRFADLYKFGSAGMIYAPASVIKDSTIADHLLKNSSAKARGAKNSSTSSYNANLIDEVLEQCIPSEKSSSTNFKSIVDTMKFMVNTMYNRGVLVPDNTDPKIDSYLKGTIKPNIKSRYVRDMYEFILRSLHSSVSKGNLTDGIIASCIREYGFYIVPRSVDSITILPMSYTAVSPEQVPTISSDRYHSLSYNPKSNVGTDIQGVLVTYAGSSTVNSSSHPNALVRGRFPENTGSEAVRWACIPSPGWFNGVSALFGNNKNNSQDTASDNKDYIKELCTAYAADRYQYMKYRNNSVTLASDLRSLRAYSALGASFDIEYPQDPAAKSSEKVMIRATLESYSLHYKSSESSSGVDITLGFCNARSSKVDSLEPPGLLLYSIQEEDIIKEFPDLSKPVKSGVNK